MISAQEARAMTTPTNVIEDNAYDNLLEQLDKDVRNKSALGKTYHQTYCSQYHNVNRRLNAKLQELGYEVRFSMGIFMEISWEKDLTKEEGKSWKTKIVNWLKQNS